MNQSDLLFKNIVEKMVVVIAYFKVITNKKGMPIDLLILNINSSFEEKTGLVAKKVIGKSINQIFPLASKDKDKWIELCGKVALKKKSLQLKTIFKDSNAG